jgi:hypothetical protein
MLILQKTRASSINLPLGEKLVFELTVIDNEAMVTSKNVTVTIIESQFEINIKSVVASYRFAKEDTDTIEVRQQKITQGPYYITSGDIDEDGDNDVIVSSSIDKKLIWLVNNGISGFSTKFIHDFGDIHPGRVSIHDIDNDGDLDLMVGIESGNLNTFFLINDGNENFSAPIRINNFAASYIKMADLNGDGWLDLIGSFAGSLRWIKSNLGTLGGQPITQIVTSIPLEILATGDIDKDGDIDMLVVHQTSNISSLYWLSNKGNGDLESPILLASVEGQIKFGELGDLDKDGDLDIVYTESINDNIAWLENFNNGLFSQINPLTTTNRMVVPADIQIVDFNNDGSNDILINSQGDHPAFWFKNESNGSFSDVTVSTSGYNSAVYSADLDGDNLLDVLVAESSVINKLVWYKQSIDETFNEQEKLAPIGEQLGEVKVVDFDGDQDLDIIASITSAQKFVWFENNGDQSFSDEQLLIANTPYIRSYDVADIDNDEYIDIAYGIYDYPGEIGWYKKQEDGLYSDKTVLLNNASAHLPRKLSLIDLENDGDIDIVFNGPFLTMLINNQQDFVLDNSLLSATSDFENFNFYDLDKDGDKEILLTNTFRNKLSWLDNYGDSTFSATNNISSTAKNVIASYAADLNGDSLEDIIVILNSDYSPAPDVGEYAIVWYPQIRQGVFDTAIIIDDQILSPQSIAVADFNLDGLIDLVVNSDGANNVVLYSNQGNSTFAESEILLSNIDGPKELFAVDFDKDGDPDVLSVSINDGKIIWLENKSRE